MKKRGLDKDVWLKLGLRGKEGKRKAAGRRKAKRRDDSWTRRDRRRTG